MFAHAPPQRVDGFHADGRAVEGVRRGAEPTLTFTNDAGRRPAPSPEHWGVPRVRNVATYAIQIGSLSAGARTTR
jgi:hypothetical protein